MSLIILNTVPNLQIFSVFLLLDLVQPFPDIKKYQERYATLVSAKPEKLKHKINKNWHGSSHVIAWAALPYLLIKVFSGPAL